MGEISESMGRVRKPNGGCDLKMKGVGGIKTSGRHGVFNSVDTLLALSVSLVVLLILVKPKWSW